MGARWSASDNLCMLSNIPRLIDALLFTSFIDSQAIPLFSGRGFCDKQAPEFRDSGWIGGDCGFHRPMPHGGPQDQARVGAPFHREGEDED